MSQQHLCDSFTCSCYLRSKESTAKNLIAVINRELDIIESNDSIEGFFHDKEMEELRQRLIRMYKRK